MDYLRENKWIAVVIVVIGIAAAVLSGISSFQERAPLPRLVPPASQGKPAPP